MTTTPTARPCWTSSARRPHSPTSLAVQLATPGSGGQHPPAALAAAHCRRGPARRRGTRPPLRFGGGGEAAGRGRGPSFVGAESEPERFSKDRNGCRASFSPRREPTSGSTQMSRTYGREIRTLDAIPDEELDAMARRGITDSAVGLWSGRQHPSDQAWRGTPTRSPLPTPWTTPNRRRSRGYAAHANLRDRAAARGIRLASDMVPNHMGIDFALGDRLPRSVHRFPSRVPRLHLHRQDPATRRSCRIRLEDHY